MVFSPKETAVIENDFLEDGWSAYRICKEHPSKSWALNSVKRLLRKYKETGSMERRKGSGCPVSATTVENEEKIEEMICSQEEPGTHTHPREIAKQLGISHTSVRRLIKKKKINQYKRVKAPRIDTAGRKRRTDRAGNLTNKFGKNPRIIERVVFQDEKDFTLAIPLNHQNKRVYYKGKKTEVPPENLFHESKGQSRKVMVSACLRWYGETNSFFVNDKGLKVDGISYKNHLKNQLFLAIKNVYKRKN